MNNDVRIELSDAAKRARREYHRRWAKENPEKVRAITMRYWMKKAAELPDQSERNGDKDGIN